MNDPLTNPPDTQPPRDGLSLEDRRAERLAGRLRENLHRRKAQARARDSTLSAGGYPDMQSSPETQSSNTNIDLGRYHASNTNQR